MWSDGRISIGQCDLVETWDNLSLSQKKNLNYRYQMGCECRVSKDCSFSVNTYLSLSHSSICLREASGNKATDIANRSLFSSITLVQTFFPFHYKYFQVSFSVNTYHRNSFLPTFTPEKLLFITQTDKQITQKLFCP